MEHQLFKFQIVPSKPIVLNLAFVLFVFGQAIAQRSINGRVTEGLTGLPVPGASVRAEGSSRGALSDAKGRYSLTLPGQADYVTVSHPAFREKQVPVLSSGVLNITLSADIQLFRIKANVVDANTGKPLAGVKVVYLREKTGFYTDERGAFSTSVSAKSAVFSFSRSNYESLTTTLKAGEENTVRLEPTRPSQKEPASVAVSNPPQTKKTEQPATYATQKPGESKKQQSPPAPEIRSAEKPSSTEAERKESLPWWKDAQYTVPILVAFIGGFFSILQVWLSKR